MRTRISLTVTVAAAMLGTTASAQLPNASARAFGMAGNYSALARGYAAVAWNPALLGMDNNPIFSFATASIGGFSALKPIDMSAVKPFEGRDIPSSTRQEWLAKVTAQGGEDGRAEGGATLLGLSMGRLAFQVASAGYAEMNVAPDAFEALMFGNAGLTGEPRPLDFSGSMVDGAAFTTAAASLGIPTSIDLLGGRLALGVTGKYVLGNAMARGEDNGSAIPTTGSATLRFPVIYADPTEKMDNGHGIGVDVGAAFSLPGLTLSAALQNVANTFRWDTTTMYAKMVSASFDGTVSSADMIDVPYDSAPASLRSAIGKARFARIMSAGAALSLAGHMTLTADVRHSGEGMVIGARNSAGLGLEVRTLGFLPLRGGVARVDDGWQMSAGAGLRVWAFEVAVSAARRQLVNGSATGVMVGLVSLGR
jgi:hypothetical protein